MMTSKLAAATSIALLATGLTACGSDSKDSGTSAGGSSKTTDVVVSFYPLQYLAEQIGGEHVKVTSLTAPGKEPHDLELTPQQMATASKAAVGVYEKGLQPDVDKAFADAPPKNLLDVATVADLSLKFEPTAAGGEVHDEHDHADEHKDEHKDEHASGSASASGDTHSGDAHSGEAHAEEHHHDNEAGTTDPHFWLDPVRYQKVADAIKDQLVKADPDHKADFEKNAAKVKADLTSLDGEFKTGLASCKDKNVVTSHAAFGYLTARYGLKQVAIAGLSPEQEPEPKQLAEIAAFAKKNKVSTIYTETLASPAIAKTVAAETGATTAVLDPIEGITDHSAAKDYPGLMRANLAALKKGQSCQ